MITCKPAPGLIQSVPAFASPGPHDIPLLMPADSCILRYPCTGPRGQFTSMLIAGFLSCCPIVKLQDSPVQTTERSPGLHAL